MSTICEGCGAPAPANARSSGFVCNYCGGKNLPDASSHAAVSLGKAEERYQMGLLVMQSGEYAKAVEAFQKVLAVQPDHIDAQLCLAWCYLKSMTPKTVEARFAAVCDMLSKLDRETQHSSLEEISWREVVCQLLELAQQLAQGCYSVSARFRMAKNMQPAMQQLQMGLDVVLSVLVLGVPDAHGATHAALNGWIQCQIMADAGGDRHQLADRQTQFLQHLLLVAEAQPALLNAALAVNVRYKNAVIRALVAIKPALSRDLAADGLLTLLWRGYRSWPGLLQLAGLLFALYWLSSLLARCTLSSTGM